MKIMNRRVAAGARHRLATIAGVPPTLPPKLPYMRCAARARAGAAA
jgi:hypothetical protein